jgi:hypothetical protein
MYQSPKENPLYHQLIRQIKTNDIRLRTPKRGIPLAEEKAQYRLLERQQDMLYEQLSSGTNLNSSLNTTRTNLVFQRAILTAANGPMAMAPLIRF